MCLRSAASRLSGSTEAAGASTFGEHQRGLQLGPAEIEHECVEAGGAVCFGGCGGVGHGDDLVTGPAQRAHQRVASLGTPQQRPSTWSGDMERR